MASRVRRRHAQVGRSQAFGLVAAGWGGADKAQVQQMVQTLLGLAKPPHPADAADAAALALCHAAMAPMRDATRRATGVAPTPGVRA